MKRIVKIICVIFCLAAQASLFAVNIQTATGHQLINVDESVVRLWGKLFNDIWPGGVAPAPFPAVIQLPGGVHAAAADYQNILNQDHEVIKILQELQNILNSSPALFNDLINNQEKILDKVSDAKFVQPENVFGKDYLDRHPKKKIYQHSLAQRDIDPRRIYPLLKAAYDHNFAPQICSGLARLYAIALFASIRQINNDENELAFIKAHDIEHMNQEQIQDFINLDELNPVQCNIKNEIKRQYLVLYAQWIDGRSVNLSHQANINTAVCEEIVWLIRAKLIPPVVKIPILGAKTIADLAQEFFNYVNSWKYYLKQQVPNFLGIVNPLWKELWWAEFLPEELRKEFEKLMLIHKNKRLTNDRIVNLSPNDLIELSNAGKVPPCNHVAVPTMRTIAKQWVKDWFTPSWTKWYYNDEDLWKFVDDKGNPASWLLMLPNDLIKDICRYHRCAAIKKEQKWIEKPHLGHSEADCQLGVHHLTDYGVIPLPQGTNQAGLEGMNTEEQARAYAIDFIARMNAKAKNIHKIAFDLGCMSPSFKKEVCRQYALQTMWRGELLEKNKDFKNILQDEEYNNLTTTLAEALQNDEVKRIIADKVRKDQILDLSGMHLRELAANNFVGGPNAIGALPGVQLNQVTILDLSNNKLAQFPVGILNHLPALRVLKLSHNHLQTLPQNLFGALGAGHVNHIKEIWCDHNRINQLPLGLFIGLENNPALDVVDLSHNLLQDPDHMPLFGALKVKSLNLSYNRLETLPANIFSHTMGAEGAIPVEVADQTFRSKIRELNLAYNQLTCGMNDQVQRALASLSDGGTLEYLDLSNNQITQVHPLVHCRFIMLKHLFLDNNQIVAIMSQNNGVAVLQNMENLVTLSLAGNRLAAIAQNDFVPFPNLTRLILSGNQIANIADRADVAQSSELSRLVNLATLFLDRNKLANIVPKTFKNLRKLEVLHLEGNEIVHIPQNSFRELENLTVLYLYGNSRNFSFDNQQGINNTDIADGALSGLGKLLYLDLSFNAINELSEGVFDGLSKLTHLNLGHNKLERLSYQLDPLVKLQEIDLSQNRLKGVESQTFLTQKHIKHVCFKGNNACGIFKLTSHLTILSLNLPHLLRKIPLFGRITSLILGDGVDIDIERMNKFMPDLVRLYRALMRNKKFGIPGLLYLFKIVGFPNNSEKLSRELQTVAELGDELAQQFGNLTALKRLATIDDYFKQLNSWHQELAFGTMRDSKVREQKL